MASRMSSVVVVLAVLSLGKLVNASYALVGVSKHGDIPEARTEAQAVEVDHQTDQNAFVRARPMANPGTKDEGLSSSPNILAQAVAQQQEGQQAASINSNGALELKSSKDVLSGMNDDVATSELAEKASHGGTGDMLQGNQAGASYEGKTNTIWTSLWQIDQADWEALQIKTTLVPGTTLLTTIYIVDSPAPANASNASSASNASNASNASVLNGDGVSSAVAESGATKSDDTKSDGVSELHSDEDKAKLEDKGKLEDKAKKISGKAKSHRKMKKKSASESDESVLGKLTSWMR